MTVSWLSQAASWDWSSTHQLWLTQKVFPLLCSRLLDNSWRLAKNAFSMVQKSSIWSRLLKMNVQDNTRYTFFFHSTNSLFLTQPSVKLVQANDRIQGSYICSWRATLKKQNSNDTNIIHCVCPWLDIWSKWLLTTSSMKAMVVFAI